MIRRNGCRAIFSIFLLCIATAIASPAQTLTTLVSFNSGDGGFPNYGSLVQGRNGNLYGITAGGGHGLDCGPYTFVCGTVFVITPTGKLTTLHSFCLEAGCPDGESPQSGLVLASNGNFYGTTYLGGANRGGTVFQITPEGTLTTIYNFCAQANCSDGDMTSAPLVKGENGNFYGGNNYGVNNCGTLFEVTSTGTLTTLYSFECNDGEEPSTGLVEATNGNFYGTTQEGGPYGNGVFYKLTPSGEETTLYMFCATGGSCPDGATPLGSLLETSDGNLYGTTDLGGENQDGTIFEMTTAGKLTTLHMFTGADGSNPQGGLVKATDGNLYGTTTSGGANSSGTIFQITPAGKLTTLYNFCSQPDCADGEAPQAQLMQATNGLLYGSTQTGGEVKCNSGYGCGTIFSLNMGLSPFVTTQPTAGKTGATVIILGNNLTGSTGVSFNGTAATFTVVSDTEIRATVPTGATTGPVAVTTPGGVLASNLVFRVP